MTDIVQTSRRRHRNPMPSPFLLSKHLLNSISWRKYLPVSERYFRLRRADPELNESETVLQVMIAFRKNDYKEMKFLLSRYIFPPSSWERLSQLYTDGIQKWAARTGALLEDSDLVLIPRTPKKSKKTKKSRRDNELEPFFSADAFLSNNYLQWNTWTDLSNADAQPSPPLSSDFEPEEPVRCSKDGSSSFDEVSENGYSLEIQVKREIRDDELGLYEVQPSAEEPMFAPNSYEQNSGSWEQQVPVEGEMRRETIAPQRSIFPGLGEPVENFLERDGYSDYQQIANDQVFEPDEVEAPEVVKWSLPTGCGVDYRTWNVDQMAQWVYSVTECEKCWRIVIDQKMDGASMTCFLPYRPRKELKIECGKWWKLRNAARLVMKWSRSL